MIAATDGDTNQAGFAGGRKRCVQVATQGHVYTTSVQHDDIFLVLLHVLPIGRLKKKGIGWVKPSKSGKKTQSGFCSVGRIHGRLRLQSLKSK